MEYEENFHIKNHIFDIDQGSLFYLCKDKASGDEEWNNFDESNNHITKYWNGIDDHVPLLVESLIFDQNSHIQDCICLKDGHIYVLKNGSNHYLVPKNALQNRNPNMIVDYNVLKLSSL